MPCSSQKVETAPRGASSGHCEIARRTRGSMGSWAATAAASWWKCHHQHEQECHRCPDADSSPMSRDMTNGRAVTHAVYRTDVRLHNCSPRLRGEPPAPFDTACATAALAPRSEFACLPCAERPHP